MNLVYKLQHKSMEIAVEKLLKYIDKDPQGNIIKLADRVAPVFSKVFPPKTSKKSVRRLKMKIMFGLNSH